MNREAIRFKNRQILSGGSSHYYRDKNKREIDLLLHYDGTLLPVEIKKSATPGGSAIKHFHVLDQSKGLTEPNQVQIGSGAVICMVWNLLSIDNNNWYVPAWLV